MTTTLEGETAIVTGTNSGIGAATCRELALEGANVVLAARSEDRLRDLATDLETNRGVETLVAPTDVREEGEVRTRGSRRSRPLRGDPRGLYRERTRSVPARQTGRQLLTATGRRPSVPFFGRSWSTKTG